MKTAGEPTSCFSAVSPRSAFGCRPAPPGWRLSFCLEVVMNKPARVYLHPACASSPESIRAVEEATGRIARRDRGSPVVRLVPALRLVTPAAKRVSA